MVDLTQGLEDWAANKFLVAPALQILVNDGVLTLSGEHTVEQAADLLLNAVTAMAAQKVADAPVGT